MKRAVWTLALALAACAVDRPIHPLALEGFPGAPIEPGLFPLRPGMRWQFKESVGGEDSGLELTIVESEGGLALTGTKEGEVAIRARGGFLELIYRGQVLDRPLKFEGKVGDTWRAAGALYTVFGYDQVMVLGRRVRALVVAADRPPVRDLYWFAPGTGWVRLRTERSGKAYRDASLESFSPGRAN